ncbi:MAG: ABC transporter permease [Deltaproteobacteria bacterium]|nr:ABC transporter permease [Deltaproteobacteria bacterium]
MKGMILMLPGFWVKTAGLFLIRSGRSTAVLSLMVASAVAALVFLSSLAEGINDAMIRSSVRLFSGHISGFNLPHSVNRETLAVVGVSNVLKRVLSPGVLFHGDRFEMITLIAVDPEEEKKSTAIWKKTVDGKYLERGDNAIFLSKGLADRLNIQTGDDVRFSRDFKSYQNTLTVSGLYETGIDQIDRGIAFCPMGIIPATSKVWNAAVFLNEGVDTRLVIAKYANLQVEASHFKAWFDLMPDLKQLIDLNYICMNIVTVLVFGVVSLGIGCAFTIFILKNLREYGIMKAMGVTSRETTFLILQEVVLMNLAASSIGLIVGVIIVSIFAVTGLDLTAFTSHNRYFIVSGIIFPRLTLYSLCVPPALAFIFSVFAAIWPAMLVKRKKVAAILRSI